MGGIPYELGRDDDGVDARTLGGVTPRRRSLWALGALGLGFSIARSLGEASSPTPAAWFAACQALLALALLSRGAWCRALLFAAATLFGAGWFTDRFYVAPPDRVDQLIAHDTGDSSVPLVVTLTGEAIEPPRFFTGRAGALGAFARVPSSWVFPLRVTGVELADGMAPASGIVRVSLRHASAERPPSVRAGDTIRMTGQFAPIPLPLNPGEPNRRLLALQEGVIGRLIVPGESLIEPLDNAMPGWWARSTAWARDRAGAALGLTPTTGNDNNAATGRALLAAMLLGVREPGIDDVDAAFRRVGLVHLVAISGFNLALLASATGLLLRFLGDRGGVESLGIAAVIGLYLLIVPGESPILRAGLTVIAFLLAESLGRRYDRLTLLGWIACALLLWRPLDLWSLGFQLSFGIVGALLWLGRRVEHRLFGVPLRGVVSVGIPIGARPGLLERGARAAWRFIADKLKVAISASLLAWSVAAPVIIVHTGIFSPWAPLTGLIALPIASATLCAGYAALLVGFAWPSAGAAVATLATWLADTLASLVLTLDTLPGACVELPRLSALCAGACVGVILFWFARGTRRSRLAWALTGIAACWLGIELYASTRLPSSVALRIDTLAVGDGTCHLIRAGDSAMLWDCGSSHPGLGLRELPRAIRAVGAARVRVALVTHANMDHFLCLPDVVEPLGIRHVFIGSAFLEEAAKRPDAASAALMRELESRGVGIIEARAGARIRLGPIDCEILSPDPGDSFAEANDTSLVGLFRVPTRAGERRLLMTGDIGPAAIAHLLDAHPELSADILELPHHGSAKPEAMLFTRHLNPGVVLQSTGPQRLADRRWDALKPGRAWRVTASHGAAWATITRDGAVRSGTLR